MSEKFDSLNGIVKTANSPRTDRTYSRQVYNDVIRTNLFNNRRSYVYGDKVENKIDELDEVFWTVYEFKSNDASAFPSVFLFFSCVVSIMGLC